MPVLSPVLIGNTESWQAGMPVLPAETAVGVQKLVETRWKSRLAGLLRFSMSARRVRNVDKDAYRWRKDTIDYG